MSRVARSLLALSMAAAMSGCAVGPNFHAPPPPTVTGLTPEPLPAQTDQAAVALGEAQRFPPGQDVPGRWWTLYRSPILDALVERALKNNADLQAAQAALRVAREAYLAQRGALLPTVDVGYSGERSKSSDTLAPPLNIGPNIYTLHTAQVTVGYTLDVFGGVRRQTETTLAQAEAQRFQTEAAYLTLTTNLVAAVVQDASIKDQIAATEAIIEADAKSLDILRRQFDLGAVARADVASQEAALAQAELALPALKKQLAQQRDLIAALTGDYPGDSIDQGLTLASLTLPRDLPVSLPSSIVSGRPDIAQASANLHAASAQVGVAIADRLPNFALSAQAGGLSTDIGQIFANSNLFYSLIGSATQPIFHGGTLLHRQRGAEAALDQAKAQYRSTVIDAFQNVADTLQALQADATALSDAARSEKAAADSLDIARRQQALGAVNTLAVLVLQQAYQQAALARVQAQAARLADTAALYQSLGGGWWNRAETTASR
jgi:NodT family efflux transporter outer membrane factor (OMF) lipoprotein